MEKTLIINRKECEDILSIEKSIPEMRNVLSAISDKQTKVMQRSMIPHEGGNMLAIMPASLLNKNVTGSKVIIFPGKEAAKNKTHQGIIPLFDTITGALKAIVDAELITVVRTAATTAVATDVLANKNAKTVAILGSGKQGRAHAEAMLLVRDIKKVYMWDIFSQASKAACEELSKKYNDVEFIACDTAKDCVADADIVCTTTPGKNDEPIICFSDIKRGAHINAIGACSPVGREISGDIVENCRIFTDWTDAVLKDAGDILIPHKKGEIKDIPQLTEAGAVINGVSEGRKNENEITVFESVGISVEDIAAANLIYEYAKEHNIGTYIEI